MQSETMSEPLEIEVRGELMGLARMGRKTAAVVPNVIATALGEYVLVDATADHIRVPVVVHRVSYTTVGCLTTEDALAAGHPYLHELEAALRKVIPHLEPESLVTIFHWVLAREVR